ncbi:MAG: VCBS repeat-containing protein [Tunicatimonas sp.]
MKALRTKWYILSTFWLVLGCHPSEEPAVSINRLFTTLPASYTGIDFVNQLSYDEEFNVYTYRNFYNGGGVGVGDVNNDGLTDVFFCGNLVDNRLYLNRGDFRFEDITPAAGVASRGVWSTGVSLADVNGDGWLDIYVCKSGSPQGKNRHNELFINNADPSLSGLVTFSEQAHAYGIADQGLSTHATFFDYDRDGDLDMYLLNNSFRSVGGYDLRPGQREVRDPEGGNKLYRNDNGKFVDVSEAAGIYGSAIGFGLGVTIGDVNRDGWQDIYVSNDFFERDYLYINNGDGTGRHTGFTEDLEAQMSEISLGSMGADMADINHDGYPDVFVTEMLPDSERRYKTKAAFETWDKYRMNVKNGYHQQFARNVLQLNAPPASSGRTTVFREIGRLAGVHATDWSWGALMADLDNNGHTDIFVANGIYKDLLDQDYIQFMGDPKTVRAILSREKTVIQQLIDSIPSEKIANYAFANQGDFTFVNQAEAWGLGEPSHSNGSAYGDLDNDGDLDLIVNNVNMPPFVYRNETDTLLPQNHSLSVKLVGEGNNTFALGAQVTLWSQGKLHYQELAPMRGFESTVDTKLVFGLGAASTVDSLRVQWPDGRSTFRQTVSSNQLLELHQAEATELRQSAGWRATTAPAPWLEDITASVDIDYQHRENEFSDFNRDPLLFHMLSAEGPKLATGDVNGDGQEDFFVGGAKDQPGALFVQKNGTFVRTNETVFTQDQSSEDTDALLFDADQDGDLDLYVASGGSELPSSSSALLDRLYLNDGRGNFTKSAQLLPTARFESTACVRAADYDQDGDQDLFVGLRLRPFLYGVPVNGYILQNDGRGNFRNVTEQAAPELVGLGMITAAQWADYDQDQDIDLIIVGDWMGVRVFSNQGGTFADATEEAGLAQTQGFWNCLEVVDLDGDGDLDFVAGNLGRNARLKASPEQPLTMHVNDFDGNGKAEQIVSMYQHDTLYPLTLRNDLVKQVPSLKKKYLRYDAYQGQTIDDLFTPKQLRSAVRWEVRTTESAAFINQGDSRFVMRPLPAEAQFSPVYSILADDFDEDGHVDLLLGGNFYRSKPEIGIYDASHGLLLKGNGTGQFAVVEQSGFFVRGEVRDMVPVRTQKGELVLVAKNNAPMQIFRRSSK